MSITPTEISAALEKVWRECLNPNPPQWIMAPRNVAWFLKKRLHRGIRLVEITEIAVAELDLHQFVKARNWWRRTVWIDKRRLRRAQRKAREHGFTKWGTT